MAVPKKLKCGHGVNEKVKENKKFQRGDSVHKGKDKITSVSSDEVDGDNMDIESKDTQSTASTRGRTKMGRLTILRTQGTKKNINFNSRGQPIGKTAAEMQSFIGVLARENVKITYNTWKQVPKDIKELIWESVNFSFNVDQKWKKSCLASAGTKWRQYKVDLTKKFIKPNKDKPENLRHPPEDHEISQEDWSAFVISRMSESFTKLSNDQRERSKANKYHHRLARKGYARLELDLESELCDDDEINRAILWKKGQTNKKGEIEGDDLKQIVEKIDSYIELKKEGKLKIEGSKEDILTKALDSQEHAGRMRGLGRDVTPTMYFNVATGKKHGELGMLSEQHKELMEAKKKIDEQNAQIKQQNVQIKDQNARLQSLEAFVYKKRDIDHEEKGSCSGKLQSATNKDGIEEDEEFNGCDVQLLDKNVALQGSAVALTLESNNNIVAYGTIVHVDGPGNFLDGEPLPKHCMCVAIDHAIDEVSRLPVQIPRTCQCIGDAVGNHVAWPSHLIKVHNEIPSRKNVGHAKKTTRVVSSNMPKELYIIHCCCKDALRDGKSIPITFDYDIFGNDEYSIISLDLKDINEFCELMPISWYCIVVYIWHLHKRMKEEFVDKYIRFVHPYKIGYMPTTSEDKSYMQRQVERRAQALADRLNGTSPNQVVLAPCNIGYHWILTVIDPNKEIVYLLDPLGPRIRSESWRDTVNLALKKFNAKKGKKGKKQPTWELIKSPVQPDDKQCGFYIMRYMKEIIDEFIKADHAPLLSMFKKVEYSRAEIDEVRLEWAKCVQTHMFE